MKSKLPVGKYNLSIININGESEYDRKYRMISHLATACVACSLCKLGLIKADQQNEIRDPHLFGNCNPKDIIIYSYSPSFADLQNHEPLSCGDGLVLRNNLKKYGVVDYYSAYIIRCFHVGEHPDDSIVMCNNFFDIELKLIKPKLIITYQDRTFTAITGGIAKVNNIIKHNGYNILHVDVNDMRAACGLIHKLNGSK